VTAEREEACLIRTEAFSPQERGRMKPMLLVRDETPADAAAIAEVTVAAFKTLEVSNQTEHFIIEALRSKAARDTRS
jgi:hypothetical protein